MTTIARAGVGAETAASAIRTVGAWKAALEGADRPALERLLHPVWTGKHAAAGGGARTETRDAILADVGPRRRHLTLSAILPCFADFAVARLDDWQTAATSFLLLFREQGRWLIAGEASAGAEEGVREGRFTPRSAETAVLATLAEYYRAVTEGDPDAVRRIFAPFWTMTNHEDGRIVSEGVDAFAARLEAGPLPGYWDDRQIAGVQVVADRLAFVRVDRPSTPSTTVFLFMKIAGEWLVIDKAWTDGRKPA